MQERLQRVPFTRPVYLSAPGTPGTHDQTRRLVAANLSRGGMFVRGDAELPPGSRVALALEAQGQVLPFAEAEIIWTCDGSEPGPNGDTTPGSGLKFTRFLHPRSTELLGYLVNRRSPPVGSIPTPPAAPKVTVAEPQPEPVAVGTLPAHRLDVAGGQPAFLNDMPPLGSPGPTPLPAFERSIATAPDAGREAPDLTKALAPPPELTDRLTTPVADSAGGAVTPRKGPPADFMHQPLADLRSHGEEPPAPPWVTQMEVLKDDAAVVSPGSNEIQSEWFSAGEHAPGTAVEEASEERKRLGTSVALLTVLVLVAGALVWVMRQQGSTQTRDVALPVGVTSEGAEALLTPPATTPATIPAPAAEAPLATAPAVDAPAVDAPAPTTSAAQPRVAAAAPATQMQTQAVAAALTPEAAARPEPAAPAAATPVSTDSSVAATQPSSKTIRRHVFRSGAVQAVAVSSSGKKISAALDLPAGASIERVFVLKSPARVVVDVRGASPRRSARLVSKGSMVQALRVGARSGGTRLVIDMKRPVARAEAQGRTIHVTLK